MLTGSFKNFCRFCASAHLLMALNVVFGLVHPTVTLGQDHYFAWTDSLADTNSEESWDDETYYQVQLLRLQRWLREEAQDFSDPVVLQEIVRLKKEAEQFAVQQDYESATIWLETIWQLIEQSPDSIPAEDEIDADYLESLDSGEILNDSNNFTWSKQIVTGVDFWRQQLELAFLETDSTFDEGNGNPYTGIRFNFDYTSNYKNSVQGAAFLKYSRDYLSGEATFRLVKPLLANSSWQFENRFEGTSFYRDSNLRYLQNNSTLGFEFSKLGPFALEFEDDFILRHYAKEDSIYPNYFDNTVGGTVKFGLASTSFVGVGYQNILRFHPTFAENDYDENRIDFNYFQDLGGGSSLSLENQLKFRSYLHIPLDPSFQFDYKEEYLRMTLRAALASSFGTVIKGSFTNRNYELVNTTIPDYLLWEVEPEIYFNVNPEWKISLGIYYSQLNNDKNFGAIATDVVSIVQSISFEDYRTFGPTFTVELFKINGLMLSVRDSFLMERHPNARVSDIDRFNLYSDRNINSVLLFLNWTVSRQWELNILGNLDNDHSLKDNFGNTQNTIVSFEVTYSF